jgi:hypothetical protein
MRNAQSSCAVAKQSRLCDIDRAPQVDYIAFLIIAPITRRRFLVLGRCQNDCTRVAHI